MKRLISTKEMNLLRRSEVTKKHKILMDLMSRGEKELIEQSVYLEDEIKAFLKTLYPQILQEAKNEWDIEAEGIEYFKEKRRCGLCNRSTRNVCLIKNKLNDNTLSLGPSCIDIIEASKDININKILRESRREKISEELNVDLNEGDYIYF